MPTTRQSEVKLNPRHRYVTERQSNVAGTESLVLEVETPPNTRLRYGTGIDEAGRGAFYPRFKLYKSDGSEIERDARILFAARAAKAGTRTYLGHMTYGACRDLTAAEQGSRLYRDQVRATLDQVGDITEGNVLEVRVESDDVIDWTQSATVFEFSAAEVRA